MDGMDADTSTLSTNLFIKDRYHAIKVYDIWIITDWLSRLNQLMNEP
jgi:hypothetical protein